MKASKRHGLQKMKNSFDDSLLKLDRIPDILGIEDVSTLHEDNPEAWHAQVYFSSALVFNMFWPPKLYNYFLSICRYFVQLIQVL